MNIELTQEQQRALDAQTEGPARVIDPRTQVAYVLVPAEEYERMCPAPPPPIDIEIPPGIRRSKEAFLRDLPELLANRKHEGWWVGYHGDQRIGPFYDSRRLLKELDRRRVSPDEYYLGIIRLHEPEPEEVEPIHGHHFQDFEP